MKLIIYDTKIGKKVELKPQEGNTLKMYTCGPTVYNFAHIGNLRTYLFEDLLRRTILLSGMEIMHVMNITDVDDKTIRASIAAGLPLKAFTAEFTEAFFNDLKVLNIQPAEIYPAATDHVDEMISMINSLIDKDYAYIKNGNVFFRIAKFKEYGALSHLDLEDLKIGASKRVDCDEYDKESLSDFVLWKAYDEERDGEVFWETPWGQGRPGWHIECSAMAIRYLGETIDLHVGGVDNIFPHHENEIAQSEACTGSCFSKYWMHASHLIVDGKKMSKSLGNFYTLGDLLDKGYSGREVRYLLISTHYRTQLNFTIDGLDGARNTLRRIDDFNERLQKIDETSPSAVNATSLVSKMKSEFMNEIFDDLNISNALATLFDFIRTINGEIDKGRVGLDEAKLISQALIDLDQVLAIMDKESIEVPQEVMKLFDEREAARKSKDWALSDALRDNISTLGFVVEDSASGSCVKPKLN